jgi:hypothetical protein
MGIGARIGLVAVFMLLALLQTVIGCVSISAGRLPFSGQRRMGQAAGSLWFYCRKDYYHLLGLQKGCDERQLKKAYRKLALKFHPVRPCLILALNKLQHLTHLQE